MNAAATYKTSTARLASAGGGLLLSVVLLLLRDWSTHRSRKGDATEAAATPMTVSRRALAWIRSHLHAVGQRHKIAIGSSINTDSKQEKHGGVSQPGTTGTASTLPFQVNNLRCCCSESGAPKAPSERRAIRDNQRLIQSVLQFWFGQGPEVAQKKLWMISQQNVGLRRSVDWQIGVQFGSLLVDLARTATTEANRWKEWCEDDLYGYQGKIAAIIVLDQFSRHVHRLLLETPESLDLVLLQLLKRELPEQSVLDALACTTAAVLTEQHATELQSGMVPTPMRIFALFPYRHASAVASVQWTQQQTEELAAMHHNQYGPMIMAFRKATNRRLAVLQDEERRTRSTTATGTGGSGGEINGEQRHACTDDDILECGYFAADLTSTVDHVVHRTIRNFLTSQGVCGPNGGACSGSPSVVRPIIVSLSGGVDSMVICAVLAYMQQQCGYSLRIVAVHIDYANRPESAAEAAYVKRYCLDRLGIEFYCRRIDEVTRGITARDEYERIAREIRYKFYQESVTTCLNNAAIGDSVIDIGVVLGHHRGDLRENVLSNAHKGCGPLDLSGMTATSVNNGVTLYRPLLQLEKKDIFDYAHVFGVPYFKDTTPHWSTRGKLRNKLLPLLEEIYGKGSMNNLSDLAVESDECRALLHNVLLQPFMDSILRQPMGIAFPTAPWTDQGLFFWKFVLREVLHSAGLGMFTDKSVETFMNRACADKIREGWLQCRKDYAVYLREDGQVFVLYPGSFPCQKKDYYDCNGLAVAYGLDSSVQIGPWRVTAELYSGVDSVFQPDKISAALERRVFTSMEAFMVGSYEYYLEVPTWSADGVEKKPLPMAFTKFDKRSRPRAWKGVDPKIQDILPLLAADEKALKALNDCVGCEAASKKNRGIHIATPVYCIKVTLVLSGLASNSHA